MIGGSGWQSERLLLQKAWRTKGDFHVPLDINGSVGKTLAWVAFFGVRLSNLCHKYAEVVAKQSSGVWTFVEALRKEKLRG